jgi:hypothetical protein
MGLRVSFQEVGSIAFAGGVTDEDDLICRSDIFRDLLIKGILFGNALAAVVRFLSMNQMMMEIVRIVRSHRMFVCRTTSTEILVNMGGVVVDDDNHPEARLPQARGCRKSTRILPGANRAVARGTPNTVFVMSTVSKGAIYERGTNRAEEL